MEWTLNVNDMLRDEITKITNSLIPPYFEGDVRSIRDYNISYRLMQESISRVINHMGEQSADAQGLRKVITTAEKLRTADSHTIYLHKDAAANDGKGEVVGMLKVGRKHLFLCDDNEVVREVEPLCVLDFYVRRDHQRAGIGKALFDYMLKDMGTTTQQMAVDGPSENMSAFLRKKYGITRLLRQNNNFAISPYFFDNLAQKTSMSGSSTPSLGGGAVGRYTAPKPHSTIGNVIHGGVPFNPNPNPPGEERASERSVAAVESAPAPAPAPAPRGGGEPSGEVPRPCTLPVTGVDASPAAAGARSPSRRASQLTEQGFLDVKFYHKKLW